MASKLRINQIKGVPEPSDAHIGKVLAYTGAGAFSFITQSGVQGPQGEQGIQGIQGSVGPTGANGYTVRSGSGVPSSGLGVNNDFYIDTSAWTIYGPKTAGSWGSSTSIVGPTGSTGSVPWAIPPVAWAGSTAYTSSAPASVVTYQGETYVCITSHTSTGSFDGTKFTKIAAKGSDGTGTGDVSGPASSTDGGVVLFDGLTGKLLKAGTLANATGLPISTGVSGLGTGVATFLGTPSSANLLAAVTDETGTGSLVFSTSPTLTTPALGTPSAITLTNATGLPIATGVSGLGTGVATALAATPNATGGVVVFAGDYGIPSSIQLTNGFGLPVSGLSGLGTGVATFLATPSSSNLKSAITDETGSGSLVFATSPTLTTPDLGTPSAAVLTNATGLTFSGIVSGAIATAAEFLLGTASKILTAANVWSASAETDGGNTGTGTVTPDMGVTCNYKYACTGNFTLGALTNVKVGMCGTIRFTQDGTGSRTITYNSVYKVAGGSMPALSTAASTVDALDYKVETVSGTTATRVRISLSKAVA